jgi:hypothetical protein
MAQAFRQPHCKDGWCRLRSSGFFADSAGDAATCVAGRVSGCPDAQLDLTV